MTDLQVLVDAWRKSTGDVLTLLSELATDDWERPTDCPGWTVRHVVAHLAAVEHELATGDGPERPPDRVREVSPAYTQAGVDARREHTPEELTAELRAATGQWAEQLAELGHTDLAGAPERTPGGLGWDWRTLLRNRVLDIWVHEQDVRRATGRPGGMTTPGAQIAYAAFAAALPYVIGKRAGAPPGTTVVVQIGNRVTAYAVGDDGRCRLTDTVTEPTTRLQMDMEAFIVLAAGRGDPAGCRVTVQGDARFAERILRSMAVTP